jgi:GT2 family glycosyltransferase
VRRLERHRKPEIALPPVKDLATIVVPSKYADIFEGCRSSLEQYAPHAPKILVRDGTDIEKPDGWDMIQGISPFVYARNCNLGIQACSGDVLVMNDDCQFIQPETLYTLQSLFVTHPHVGILSPSVDGVANGVSCSGQAVHETKHYLSFVCVLIRRELIDKIGLLDEKFTGYGSEDVDFCRRAQHAGFALAVTSLVMVTHKHASSSYVREHALELKRAESARLYIEKWGRKTQGHYGDES